MLKWTISDQCHPPRDSSLEFEAFPGVWPLPPLGPPDAGFLMKSVPPMGSRNRIGILLFRPSKPQVPQDPYLPSMMDFVTANHWAGVPYSDRGRWSERRGF